MPVLNDRISLIACDQNSPGILLMTKKTFKIATRQSPLALWQAEHIRSLLHQHWPNINFELLPLQTSGDKFLKTKLLGLGGKGLFVKELEEALIDHRADLAVHSMKDVPVNFPQGLTLGAICQRHLALDALLSPHETDVENLPQRAIIGTSSLRRQSQLLALRPDFIIKPLRGNIHTRIQRLKDGDFTAIILAIAGLERMGIHEMIQQILPLDVMLPACGQGALGIECRSNDKEIHQLIAPLHDHDSALAVHLERHINARLGGHCHAPIAIYCEIVDTSVVIRAKVATADGKITLSNYQKGSIDSAQETAERCVQALIAQGAKGLLEST